MCVPWRLTPGSSFFIAAISARAAKKISRPFRGRVWFLVDSFLGKVVLSPFGGAVLFLFWLDAPAATPDGRNRNATNPPIGTWVPRLWVKCVSTAFFSEEFPSDFEAMTGVLDRAIQSLLTDGWILAESEAKTRLCLEEALVNAVRHGNQNDPERKVRLELLGSGDRCTIQVFDEGAGFAVTGVAQPTCEQMGGRGICLIRHYMDEVTYVQDKRCLEMKFRRQTNGRGA